MARSELWSGRRRTSRAMAEILRAKWLITRSPIADWRHQIGLSQSEPIDDGTMQEAQIWANHVDRAARRLPIGAKCLPQSIALSRILNELKIAHRVVIAHQRETLASQENPDKLHAWVEVGAAKVLGDLPGNWHVILRMPEK